jgi:glycosyltransferase involved in cell wall biosynthesis
MPTVDSAPQKEEWVAGFLTADAVFTYSDWGGKVVREQSQNRINYQGTASPGVDLELFKPVEDKKRHRTDMAFEEDAYIIGTVMRNQRRKLYPDLFQAFRTFLDNAPKELADKTYLYVHTSYPDLGWDIPSLLKEFSLGSKVLFTYICQYTNSPFCSFFQGAKTYSPYSNSSTGTLPNAGIGLTQEQMVQIFNLFDVYVQYSICEGFGMPQAEAAACGVPVMAVDYSAMADVVRQTGGIPLKVERMFRELESNAYRALPDNDYAAKAFEKFLSLNDGIKKKKGMQARKAAEKYFNWDNTAKVWENYFEHVPLTGLQGKWDTPPDLHMPPSVKKEGLNNKEFLDWIYKEVTNEPEKLNSLHALNILRDLNWGFSATGGEMVPFNQDIAFETYFNYARNKFVCEQARAGLLDMEYPDFISYADHKEEMGKRFIRMSG